ncbi:MAG: lipoyl synthase [Victivallaceae bacterium]
MNSAVQAESSKNKRLPSWLRKTLPKGRALSSTAHNLKIERLHTVCEEALCPNKTECWSQHTATYLALGSVCTRRCGFCDIDHSLTPPLPDSGECDRIADSVVQLKLRHTVITMVSRDDLLDGGATHLSEIIHKIRCRSPKTTVETLSSDFQGNDESLKILLRAAPEIFNHNLETVERLSPLVRHKATYKRSLNVLSLAAKANVSMGIKSGIMVGLGEKEIEVKQTLDHLKNAGVTIVTIGQYLRPGKKKLAVKEYVLPETFSYYQSYGESIGLFIYSGPFIRSSYNAAEIINLIRQR